MKIHFLFFLSLLLVVAGLDAARAQSKYLTKTGQVSFFSASPIEDIEAKNQQAAAVVDLAAGQLAFSVPIKGFVFKRTLMQEHFNENYLESDKFPKATFSGKITGLNAAELPKAGQQKVQVDGDLTIHGVLHHISVPGLVELKGNQLQAFATFAITPADYNIEIPLLVRDHIGKVVTIKVNLVCDPVAAAAGTTARP